MRVRVTDGVGVAVLPFGVGVGVGVNVRVGLTVARGSMRVLTQAVIGGTPSAVIVTVLSAHSAIWYGRGIPVTAMVTVTVAPGARSSRSHVTVPDETAQLPCVVVSSPMSPLPTGSGSGSLKLTCVTGAVLTFATTIVYVNRWPSSKLTESGSLHAATVSAASGFGVGVPHQQQLLEPSRDQHQRARPAEQLVGFWMHVPHGAAGQFARIVGHGSHWSAQYGVPVGAQVGVGVGVGGVVPAGGVPPPTLTDPLTAVVVIAWPLGVLNKALLLVSGDVPLTPAAMSNLQVYSTEPSGITRVLLAEYTIARSPVQSVPGVHAGGRKAKRVVSFLIAVFTAQSGTLIHVSSRSPEASMHSWFVAQLCDRSQ
jgi:hypothetical protein